MVKSGLGSDPHVSPFKLTAHLLLALWILWRLVWAGLCVHTGQVFKLAKEGPVRMVLPLALLVFTYGALVAGHKAGYIYNTFPLMGGDLIPIEIGTMGWLDCVQNPVTVQFIHRWLALLLVASLAFALATRPVNGTDRRWLKGLLHLGILQAVFGIATLLLNVHLHVALCHQALGVLVAVGTLAAAHRVRM
jgi:cytochrome c oxidase assembly protein subunit 15